MGEAYHTRFVSSLQHASQLQPAMSTSAAAIDPQAGAPARLCSPGYHGDADAVAHAFRVQQSLSAGELSSEVLVALGLDSSSDTDTLSDADERHVTFAMLTCTVTLYQLVLWP